MDFPSIVSGIEFLAIINQKLCLVKGKFASRNA